MSITSWKYIKEYTGVTSGSYMGRDDGYDVQKTLSFNNIRDLAKDSQRRNEVVYAVSVSTIDEAELNALLKAESIKMDEEAKAKQRAKDLAEVERLSKKLGI